MVAMQLTISRIFTAFFDSQKSSAIVLVACTIVSLAIANSAWGPACRGFWQASYFGLSIELWINELEEFEGGGGDPAAGFAGEGDVGPLAAEADEFAQ